MSRYPDAYVDYLIEFHATRDYFECHELLEEYWKSLPQRAEREEKWVVLIQIAVAQYHLRRGNSAGAEKMLRQASHRLVPAELDELGLDGNAVDQWMQGRLRELTEGCAVFVEYNLPLVDSTLLAECKARCKKLGLRWGAPSELSNIELVDRHRLRDRSGVIHEREEALRRRKQE